jgi:hypothetical protein
MKNYDVVIVGGSLGGVFAALGVAKSNQTCLIISKYDWIGGQLTSQAVPPDEHDYIESFGSTRTYREFRNLVRKHYQGKEDFTEEGKKIKNINPGGGWVSRISHEPSVSLKVLYEMLDPYIKSGKVEILINATVKSAEKDDAKITKVTIDSKDGIFEVTGKMFLDATDTGEFLPMSKTEFSVGSENTDEHLSNGIDDPYDVQSFTWVAAIEYDKGGNHKLEKPEMYDFFRNYKVPYDDNTILSWYFQNPHGGGKKLFGMFGNPIDPVTKMEIPPLFTYRQVVKKEYYNNKVNDVTLVNWGQNDYHFGSIFEEDKAKEHLMMSRELTKSLLYWLNTEAPRHDGGFGYPEINIRPDIVGTSDGLAQAPYIRESRRIKSLRTIKEEDISIKANKNLPHFWDSVGIGSYNIDFHLTTKSHRSIFEETHPFEIPLGSLIPVKTTNLLAACKNIGTTHITNGCYRLHPVEANVGEAAGFFAAYCNNLNMKPQDIYADKKLVSKFQEILLENGFELEWDINKLSAYKKVV